jgi:SRSO17 transposase
MTSRSASPVTIYESMLATTRSLLFPHFVRRAAADHAVAYLRALVDDVPRKNGWHLAARVGDAHPRGMQRVLDRYVWDVEAVRDALRDLVLEMFGDPAGILIIDETSFPKKGSHSVGVQRQYCGALGKITGCQIGVFLAYASPKGAALFDRELFLPESWSGDRARCRAVGVPDTVAHQSKGELARSLLARTFAAGITAAWVVADEVYGCDGAIRRVLETHNQAYVVAVRANERSDGPGTAPVSDVAAVAAATAWQTLSCGEGAQGPREYDWLWLPRADADAVGWQRGLLVRRHCRRPEALAYYFVFAPVTATVQEIVRAAGGRWAIEECFKLAKSQAGLDQYEVRSWQGWYRHTLLAMLGVAVLAIGCGKKTRHLPGMAKPG